MNVRTNIYLPQQTIKRLKQKAENGKKTMSQVIRTILNHELEKENLNWVDSVKKMINLAGKSGKKDIAKKHDKYLYKRK